MSYVLKVSFIYRVTQKKCNIRILGWNLFLLFRRCFGTRKSTPFHLTTSISPIQNQKYPKNAINAEIEMGLHEHNRALYWLYWWCEKRINLCPRVRASEITFHNNDLRGVKSESGQYISENSPREEVSPVLIYWPLSLFTTMISEALTPRMRLWRFKGTSDSEWVILK